MRGVLAWAEGVFVFVQEFGAAVSDGPGIVLHDEVISGLLGVKLEAPIALQVLPQLGPKGAVCGLQHTSCAPLQAHYERGFTSTSPPFTTTSLPFTTTS